MSNASAPWVRAAIGLTKLAAVARSGSKGGLHRYAVSWLLINVLPTVGSVGVAVIRYPVMARPPLSTGATHVTVAVPHGCGAAELGETAGMVAFTEVGAPGRPIGMTRAGVTAGSPPMYDGGTGVSVPTPASAT